VLKENSDKPTPILPPCSSSGVSKLFCSRATKAVTQQSEGHISCYSTVRGPDILQNVIVSGNVSEISLVTLRDLLAKRSGNHQ